MSLRLRLMLLVAALVVLILGGLGDVLSNETAFRTAAGRSRRGTTRTRVLTRSPSSSR